MEENEEILTEEPQEDPIEVSDFETEEDPIDASDVEPEEEDTNIPVIPDDWAMPEPYHKYITMGDGTDLDGHVVRTSMLEGIWVFMDKTDMGYPEIIQIFANPEKTSIIQSHEEKERTETYTGYTRIVSINTDNEGKFIIGLAKPVE